MIPSEFIRKRYVDEENNITHNFRIQEIQKNTDEEQQTSHNLFFSILNYTMEKNRSHSSSSKQLVEGSFSFCGGADEFSNRTGRSSEGYEEHYPMLFDLEVLLFLSSLSEGSIYISK